MGGRFGSLGRRGLPLLLLGELPLALLLALLGQQRLADPLVLEALALDLLEVDDLRLGGGLQLLELLALGLHGSLVLGHLLLVGLQFDARLVVGVHGIGRGLGDDVHQDLRLQLLARLAIAGQQRDPGAATRHEAVDGDLLDRRPEGLDLLLQLSVLGGQPLGLVTEHLQFGLGGEEVGGGLVGSIAGGLDLLGGPLRRVVVGLGACGVAEQRGADDQQGRGDCCKGPTARHGRAG